MQKILIDLVLLISEIRPSKYYIVCDGTGFIYHRNFGHIEIEADGLIYFCPVIGRVNKKYFTEIKQKSSVITDISLISKIRDKLF